MSKPTGEKNLEVFEVFIAKREERKDWNDYVTSDRSKLQRGQIVKECGFSRSVLQQNKFVAGRLRQLEKDLRERSILKGTDEETDRERLELQIDRDKRIQSLENRTEGLESSIDGIRQSIEDVEQQIDEILLT